jgi:uncharacterized protein YuzE
MKVTYDRKADILYIKLKNAKITNTCMLSEDVHADTDENQNIVGIEIWKASKNVIQPISKDIAEEVKATLYKCA